ncbi:MAG TPA: sugar ABC transporter permease [Actinopolymorphaceae bacterium]|jgi:multiple sugar transport system permease protein
MTQREKANLRKGLLFITPWIIGVAAFNVFPLIYSIVISLTRYSGLNTPKWLGLQNYTRLFTDPIAGKSAYNTLFYLVFAVPIGLVIALALALAMNRKVREVAIYRTALYLPSLVPAFAFSFIFIVLMNPGYGMVDMILGWFGVPSQNWLGDPTGAKAVIIALAQFGAGATALIFLAGLNNIPETLYDAAKVDGAGVFRRFFSITLPLLSPVMLFNGINAVNAGLAIFTPAYIITGGGPDNGTLFYLYYLYKNAFSYAQLGYASAMAVVLFIVGVFLAWVIWILSRRFVHYSVEA